MPASIAHYWLLEPLLQVEGVIHKRMFGADAIYLEGKLVLVATEGAEPWNGLLFPVEKDRQASVRDMYPQLVPHSILPKWLYLSTSHDAFEPLSKELIELIRFRDPRFGTIPPPKKRKQNSTEGATAISRGLGHETANQSKRAGKSSTASASKALPDGRPPHLA